MLGTCTTNGDVDGVTVSADSRAGPRAGRDGARVSCSPYPTARRRNTGRSADDGRRTRAGTVRGARRLRTRAQSRDPARSVCLACMDVLRIVGAGLVLMSGGQSLNFVGVSDRVSDAVEQMEYTLGEGPCIARVSQPRRPSSTLTSPRKHRLAGPSSVEVRSRRSPRRVRLPLADRTDLHRRAQPVPRPSRRAQRRSGRRRARGGAVLEPGGVGLAGRRPGGNGRLAARAGPEPRGPGASSDRTDLGAGRDLAR